MNLTKFDYNNRYFVSASNSDNGEVDANTVFHYRQRDDVVWATYEGGAIVLGTLLAKMNADGSLDMRYQHVNRNGELMTGKCHSVPEVLPDGRYRLHESWQWTSGDRSQGQSVVEEIKND